MPIAEKSELMTAADIEAAVQRLSDEIYASGSAGNLALVGIRRRGVPLAQRIAKALQVRKHLDVPVGTLDITLYRDDLSMIAPQPVLHASEIAFNVDDKDLVLVDDVLYTGRTVRAAINALFDLGRPRRIRLCVLVDRGHRELPIEAAFVGKRVQTSGAEIVDVHLKEIDQDERVRLLEFAAQAS